MVRRLTRSVLALALAAAAFAPTASAGDWGISFGKSGKHGRVVVGVGSQSRGYGDFRRDRHYDCCRQEPGRYETVTDKIWVPGYTEKIWVPAEYRYVCDFFGRERRVLVRPGRYDVVEHRGHYEHRSRQVWVPGRTVCSSGGRHGHSSQSSRYGQRGRYRR